MSQYKLLVLPNLETHSLSLDQIRECLVCKDLWDLQGFWWYSVSIHCPSDPCSSGASNNSLFQGFGCHILIHGLAKCQTSAVPICPCSKSQSWQVWNRFLLGSYRFILIQLICLVSQLTHPGPFAAPGRQGIRCCALLALLGFRASPSLRLFQPSPGPSLWVPMPWK